MLNNNPCTMGRNNGRSCHIVYVSKHFSHVALKCALRSLSSYQNKDWPPILLLVWHRLYCRVPHCIFPFTGRVQLAQRLPGSLLDYTVSVILKVGLTGPCQLKIFRHVLAWRGLLSLSSQIRTGAWRVILHPRPCIIFPHVTIYGDLSTRNQLMWDMLKH